MLVIILQKQQNFPEKQTKLIHLGRRVVMDRFKAYHKLHALLPFTKAVASYMLLMNVCMHPYVTADKATCIIVIS